ncbi:protein ARV 1-like [Lycium ferocissimum]|uniref:protein ARV 1-like n=1 Tax=Lycium ferocissimum TaxID=112874 RepID=UPI002815290D|nr:protein ARV 1-like [Lycium ferocissimum]
MEIKCGNESEKEMSFRCVQCGFSVTTLYILYSPGNIRLMKCGNCKAAADEYIECELMILVIDLILHKIRAYRHLFYNRFSRGTLDDELPDSVFLIHYLLCVRRYGITNSSCSLFLI